MKSRATKRILSLFLALAMVVAPLTMNVFAEEVTAEPEATAAIDEIVKPDLEILENPVAPPAKTASRSVQISDGGERPYVRGKDIPLPETFTVPATRNSQRNTTTRAMTSGEAEDFYLYNAGEAGMTTLYRYAQTANCEVFIDTSLTTSQYFINEADNIAQKFEDIYRNLSNPSSDLYVGLPYFEGAANRKISILLFDIDDDGDDAYNPYVAGFFTSYDYIASNSNQWP
ncbi:MAG: hypothetical protein LBV27_09615, partial [Oscillospiraceae bacterium]|nr:hypothetical protein [Oscillospiraceae bacterium]